MASILDKSPSGVRYPDLVSTPHQNWGAGMSSMRQTEPRDYPGYERRIPTPKRRSTHDDLYEGVAETFDWHRGGVTDELQVLPTEFAQELLEYRAINGITPNKDMDTVNAWNRYKQEQYQRRGKGGWQVPTKVGSDKPVSYPISEWALESSELVNPRAIMAEARAMEEQGSAEGIRPTEAIYDNDAYNRQAEVEARIHGQMEKINQQMALDPFGANKVAIEDMPQRITNASVVQRPKFRGNF